MWTEYIPNFEKLRDIADLDIALQYSIFWVAVVMSSCIASSIAEKRLHGRALHTVLGAVIPLIYPAFISVTLSSKSKSSQKPVKTVTEEKDDLPLDDLDEAYFKSIYLDDEGNHTGPYIIDMEGEIIQGNSIVEVHPEFIVVEVTNNHGKLQRIRVPYTKITSCSEA